MQHFRRSSTSCFVKVKQQQETAMKKKDDDPEANMNNILTQSAGYCIPRLHPDHTTISLLENQYPASYPTHDPPFHLPHPIKKHDQEAYTNYDFPFNISPNNLDNYQLAPYGNINHSLNIPVSSTFIDYSTSISNNSQLPNTTHAYSSDLISYLNTFPSINQIDETILYGFDDMSSLFGADMVNAAASFTCISNPAESTSWTTMVSNNNVTYNI